MVLMTLEIPHDTNILLRHYCIDHNIVDKRDGVREILKKYLKEVLENGDLRN